VSGDASRAFARKDFRVVACTATPPCYDVHMEKAQSGGQEKRGAVGEVLAALLARQDLQPAEAYGNKHNVGETTQGVSSELEPVVG